MLCNVIELEQRRICTAYGADFFPTKPYTKLGIALKTLARKPINGLRHLPEGDTNGWYIWCGERLSASPEFFDPLHAEHLSEHLPEVVKFLGLPPGYRFSIAGSYVDVWFDSSLLHV